MQTRRRHHDDDHDDDDDTDPSATRPERRGLAARPPEPQRQGEAVPLDVHPKLTAGALRLPGLRADVVHRHVRRAARRRHPYHHGDDIFGQLGQPLVAVADGTVFSVGWNKVGGNRLWILDEQGNQFYTPTSPRSRRLRRTARASRRAGRRLHGQHRRRRGDAGITSTSRSTRSRSSTSATTVRSTRRPTSTPGATSRISPSRSASAGPRACPAGRVAPEPGAILLGMTDISTADGLDPARSQRALTPLARSALMQTLVPTTPPRRATSAEAERRSSSRRRSTRPADSRRRSRRRCRRSSPSASGASRAR